MPALPINESVLGNHVFGTGDKNKKSLSGFHSTARLGKCSLKPVIHRKLDLGGSEFYLAGWNYYDGKDTPLKWSTMFPNGWGDKKVLEAIRAAVEYWNLNADRKDGTRLNGIAKKRGLKWVGNAKVDGYVYVLGGLTKSREVVTGFPLAGANANIPAWAGHVNLDDVDEND